MLKAIPNGSLISYSELSK